MNRTIAPDIKIPQSITQIEPLVSTLSNNCKLYTINAGTQEVMRFVLVFEAGTRQQNQSFVATSAANLLNEGTIKLNSADIANQLDFYGASFEVSCDHDWTILSVYCLNKHCEAVLSLISQFILEPSYPESELAVYRNKRKQRLIMARDRIEVIANEAFMTHLYGANHVYGYSAPETAYDLVSVDLLHHYHQNYFTSKRAFMVLAGKVGLREEQLVNKYFGHSWGNTLIEELPFEAGITNTIPCVIQKKDALQTAIRIGAVLFNKQHTDFIGMLTLSTVLGGYFGSRLMQNIREDKGYTYGIYANMNTRQHSGYFNISTETGSNYAPAVLKEIAFEMERLQNDLIPDAELRLVKQFMFGEIIRALDGPWGQSEILIDKVQCQLPDNYVANMFAEIKELNATRLQELAQKYFNFNTCVQVEVGP